MGAKMVADGDMVAYKVADMVAGMVANMFKTMCTLYKA